MFSLSNSEKLLRAQYQSLPGQRPLFSEQEEDCGSTFSGRNHLHWRRELFDTGKDLPGAEERDQAILWDLT